MRKLSVYLICRDERISLVESYKSLKKNVQLVTPNIEVNINIVLQNADEFTKKIAKTIVNTNVGLFEFDNSDIGSIRNEFVAQTDSNDVVCFLMGKELFGSLWLKKATEEIPNFNFEVFYPQFYFMFGKNKHVLQENVSSDVDIAEKRGLLERNIWQFSTFALCQVYKDFPFPQMDKKIHHLELANLNWNSKLDNHGVTHRTIPGTIHFVRNNFPKKPKS